MHNDIKEQYRVTSKDLCCNHTAQDEGFSSFGNPTQKQNCLYKHLSLSTLNSLFSIFQDTIFACFH